jgi:hypothetical protein
MLGTEQTTDMDPAAGLTWENLEEKLLAHYSLKHNLILLQDRGTTPRQMAAKIRREVQAAFVGKPEPHKFMGPKRFFRGVGAKDPAQPLRNNSFGDWWFEEGVVKTLELQLARVFFTEEERRRSFSDSIRAGLAIAYDWENPLSEYWMLDLPASARLTGLVGPASAQYHAQKPNGKYDWTRKLPGGLTQIYFPVKNPLWVQRYF